MAHWHKTDYLNGLLIDADALNCNGATGLLFVQKPLMHLKISRAFEVCTVPWYNYIFSDLLFVFDCYQGTADTVS